MSTWYAIQSGNWDDNDGAGNSTQWNSAPDGSGASAAYGSQPAAYDTCDLNGNTVHVDSSCNVGGVIIVVDGTGGRGLLLWDAAFTDNTSNDWICYCNVAVGAAVSFQIELHAVDDAGACGSLNVQSGASFTVPASFNVSPNGDGYWPPIAVSGTLSNVSTLSSLVTVNDGGTLNVGDYSECLNLKLSPGGVVNCASVRGGATATVTGQGPSISLPPVGDVLSGVDRGDGQLGTRADCPTAKATTAATYGDPASPITGALDMSTYVLKTDVVVASQVLVGVPVYPGGPAGTFGGLSTAQITQLLSTVDDAAVMALVRS